MSDNRTHLEEKYTWDLTTIFATDADWETEYESTCLLYTSRCV